ncbi:hypothetical protein OE88DRAFT_1731171 [Heliocybe sulcata]|uniref:Rhodopsin domain-containing protein n=1 Tax=Heliocybe sulcata TaxID=5364 RepID=A0A5C3NEZ4_9AGAM|nr:hypothetical protein OE88DRAFT_1731171 [Heliocybe sulcata]
MSTMEAQFEELRVLSLVLPLFAIVVTLFRLAIRAWRRQLWWDDFWAMAAVLCLILFMTAMQLHFRDGSSYSLTTRIALYYMLSEFFYAVNWCSKISIFLTTIRLTVRGPYRTLLVRLACCFGVAWAILFAQVFWVCETQPGWKDTPQPQCNLGRNVAIAQVITDVATDVILIAAPLKLIWRVKVTRPQRIRITMVFGSTIIATIVSLYHAYAILRFGGFEEARAAVIQDGVSLIVADVSVIVAFFARISSVGESHGPVAVELVRVKPSSKSPDSFAVNVDTDTTISRDYSHPDGSDLDKMPSLGSSSPNGKVSALPEADGDGEPFGKV